MGTEPKEPAESLAAYHQPLEIGLKHSTISTDDVCPFIQPEKGVNALHDYAKWIVKVLKQAGAGDGRMISRSSEAVFACAGVCVTSE